jgi:PAS domain S-box-containing protein
MSMVGLHLPAKLVDFWVQVPSVLSRPRPVRTLLFYMALTLIVPSLAFSVYLVLDSAAQQRAQVEQRLGQVSADLANSIDRDVERMLTLLDTLALSDRLRAQDYAAFHAIASLAVQRAGTFIAVSDASGRQLVNTRVPFGTPLPKPPIPDAQRAALLGGKPYITDVTLGSISHKWVFGISIPLHLESLPSGIMTMVVDADHLIPIMNGLFLPPSWVTVVSDRQGKVVGRSTDQSTFAGAVMPAALRYNEDRTGSVFEAVDLKGVPSVRAIVRTKYAGWEVTAVVPTSLVNAEIRNSEISLAVAGLSLLLLALASASLFARWIIEPMQALAVSATTLEENDLSSPEMSPVAEVNEVASALHSASRELKTRELRLHQSERRLDLAQRTARLAYVDLELTQQTATVSDTFEDIFGFRPPTNDASNTLQSLIDRVHPEDRKRVTAARSEAIARLGSYEDEFRIVLANGQTRWISAHGETLGDSDGKPVRMIGTNLDITKRKEQENHIRFLLREVSHRAKNMLAIIQAMANQTARTSLSLDEFQERFGQRLRGMAASHDLLVSQNWQGVDVGELVRAQLRPFADESGMRLEISGPNVFLAPAAAQSIGLALHELATNATKYGALSVTNGKVAVSWRTLLSDAAHRFQMTWRESGGPEVTPPQRRGFGHTVFERMIKQSLGASITLEYGTDGVTWNLDAGLTSVTQEPDIAAQ